MNNYLNYLILIFSLTIQYQKIKTCEPSKIQMESKIITPEFQKFFFEWLKKCTQEKLSISDITNIFDIIYHNFAADSKFNLHTCPIVTLATELFDSIDNQLNQNKKLKENIETLITELEHCLSDWLKRSDSHDKFILDWFEKYGKKLGALKTIEALSEANNSCLIEWRHKIENMPGVCIVIRGKTIDVRHASNALYEYIKNLNQNELEAFSNSWSKTHKLIFASKLHSLKIY